jgi:copper chaperone
MWLVRFQASAEADGGFKMTEKTYSIPNISCGHCVATIAREVGAVPGVDAVNGDVEGKWITVVCEDESILPEVEDVLKEIGYPPAT